VSGPREGAAPGHLLSPAKPSPVFGGSSYFSHFLALSKELPRYPCADTRGWKGPWGPVFQPPHSCMGILSSERAIPHAKPHSKLLANAKFHLDLPHPRLCFS
jgi:hypothetical protein